jgi:hypothetical protein
MQARCCAVVLAAGIVVYAARATAQRSPAGDATAPKNTGERKDGATPETAPAETPAQRDAELAASRKAVQDLEAQVIELRRIIEGLDQSRASVDDLRRRIDEMEARLGENDRRDEALAMRGGREASVVKFHDDGFSLRSPNGRFLITPHLRVATVYTGAVASIGRADPASPDQSGFAVTHEELILDGHVGSRMFTYRLQLDAAESPTVNDAFAQIDFWRGGGLRVGQFKVPYGLQRWIWSGELEFVDISAPMKAFSLERDIGLMAIGHPLGGRLEYELAVVNGSGASLPNDNIDLAYAARIVAAPWGAVPPGEGDLAWHARPRASLGVAGYYNLVPTDVVVRTGDANADIDVDNDGRIDNVAIWQGAAELHAVWRGAAVQAEWFGRYEVPGGYFPSRSYTGAYAQASYFLIRGRLQVAGRIGATDVPRYGATPAERMLLGDHVTEQAAAVNAYLWGHRIKVQVDYTHLHAEDRATGLAAASSPTVHRLRAALQLGF